MDLGLAGRKALVTGATRGIGLAIAQTLAAQGAHLGICARDQAAVDRQVEALRETGVRAWGCATDVRDREALSRWVAGAAEYLGGIDIAISNSSAMVFRNLDDDWRSLFEVDLMGAVRLFECCRPYLEDAGSRGDGAFVVVSTISALETTRVSPYGAMKAALNHYAKGLAHEMASKRVRINVVAPGNIFVEGGLWDGIKRRSPDYFEQCLKANPTGRMGSAEEVADAVAFLASARSKFTTGAMLAVDGTLTQRV